jgi:hypothetical protein
MNEFVFRFNRRRAASRGMVFYRLLELAAGHDPVRFQDLLASRKPHAQRPQPPQVILWGLITRSGVAGGVFRAGIIPE